MNLSDAESILNYWFKDRIKPFWFQKNSSIDLQISKQFLALYQSEKEFFSLSRLTSKETILASVILFDQFPRNMFRDTKDAFTTDPLAREIAQYGVDKGIDSICSPEEKIFLYMPFMHSENIDEQAYSIALFKALGHANSLEYAYRHQTIIERFGRFPHRNKALNRVSTEDELSFLQEPDSSF